MERIEQVTNPYREKCLHCNDLNETILELSATIDKQAKEIQKLKKGDHYKFLLNYWRAFVMVLGVALIGFGVYKFIHYLNEPIQAKVTKVLVKGSTGFFIECNTANESAYNRCYYKTAGDLCPNGYKWLKGDKYNNWDLIQCNGKKK